MDHGLQMLWSVEKLFAVFLDRAGGLSFSLEHHSSTEMDAGRRGVDEKRALKFRDWGKVAATFVDLQTGRAIRIAAKESSKQAAREMFPEMPKDGGQQKAYAQLPDETLFDKKWVKVEVRPEDLPGFKGPRVVCAECGEGINFKREVLQSGRTVYRSAGCQFALEVGRLDTFAAHSTRADPGTCQNGERMRSLQVLADCDLGIVTALEFLKHHLP